MKRCIHIQEEASRCVLCADAPCSAACSNGDPARALRAILEMAANPVMKDVQRGSEWWHFTLKDEPYPDTYFTFLENNIKQYYINNETYYHPPRAGSSLHLCLCAESSPKRFLQ